VWCFSSSLGGGLVAGDETRLEISLGRDSRCFFGTQSATKVYRNPQGLPCRQDLSAIVAPKAVLVYLPDLVQLFADSTFEQHQTFSLASDSSLVLVDGSSSGRSARGERWAFSRYRSRNEISVDGGLRYWETVRLNYDAGVLSGPPRMGRFNALATLILLGPEVSTAASTLLDAVAQRPVLRRADHTVSAHPVPGGAVLRVASETVESALREIRSHLGFLSALLGDNPLARKW
jgi:urease accessory protein